MTPEIRLVGKTWLSSVTDSRVSDLKISHRWGVSGGGCWEASWSLALGARERPRGLVTNAAVDIFCGSVPIWAGSLPEIDWDSGEFTAEGAVRQGEGTIAFTSAGATTSTPNTAVDAGIARGALSWVRRVSLSSTAFNGASDSTNKLNTVSALLNAWSTEANKRWQVNPYREVSAAADPTTPMWYVMPGAGTLGVASERLVGTLNGRWMDSGGLLYTSTVGTGLPEKAVDLRPLGVLTPTRAANILSGILAKSGSQIGWTNGLTVQASQIIARGDVTPHLSRVRAGQMVRLLGLRDPRGLDTHTDIVLGETIWDVDAGTVQLNPIDRADRDLASIVEATGAQLVG